jgi:PAS domain S-box-containing protein
VAELRIDGTATDGATITTIKESGIVRGPWAGYGLGLLLAALTTAVIVLLRGGLGLAPLLLYLYLPGIFLSSWWGPGPAATMTVASIVLADIFVISPAGSLTSQNAQYIPALLTFLVVGAGTGWFFARTRSLRDRAEALSARLTEQNATYAAQGEVLQAQNEQIALQTEELAAQNEELILQAEELQAQNEALNRAREEAAAAGAAAAARAAELEAVLRVMPDGVVVSDRAGHDRLINEAMRRLASLEHAPREVEQGVAALEARAPDGRPLVPADTVTARALTGESVMGLEVQLRRPDGSARLVSTSAVPLRDARGEVVGAVTTSRDITEERRRELRLRTLASALQELAAATDPGEVLTRVTEGAGTLLDAAFTAVLLLRADGTGFTVAASHGLARRATAASNALGGTPPFLSADRSIAGRAVRAGRLLALADVAEERTAGIEFPALDRGEVRALLVAPIAGEPGAAPIGVLEVYAARRRAWTDEEQQLLGELAGAAAVALAALRRQDRASLLAEIASRISLGSDPTEALSAIAARLADTLGGWCSVSLGTAEAMRLVALAHPNRARSEALAGLVGTAPVAIEPQTAVGRALASGRVATAAVSADELAALATREDLTGAMVRLVRPRPAHEIAFPLPAPDGALPLGALYLSREDPGRPFTGEEVLFLTLVADRIAVALANARLYQETDAERARLRSVLDAMADAVFLYDAAGCLLEMSPSARRLAGLDDANQRSLLQVDASQIVEFRALDGQPVAAEELPARRALRGETLENTTFGWRTPAGRTVDVSVAAAPIRASVDGAILGAVMVARDVSAERALERQKDEFIGVASHELKSPITSIRGNVQLAMRRMQRQREGTTDAAIGQALDFIMASLDTVLAQTGRLAALIEDMLDLTRIQSGQLSLAVEAQDLGGVVRRVVETLRPTSETHRLTLAGDDLSLPVAIDARRIEQVLDNLLSNAIKYSPEATEVMVTLSCEGGEAVVRVRDQGSGIAEQDRPRVFERFYRSSAPAAQTAQGLGLGLYVSHRIVAQHGGRLWLESSSMEGSTFTFTLPLRDGGT